MRLDGLSKNVDVYGTFTAPTVNAVTANFGYDGILKINSRPTTNGYETVALQTTIDGRTDTYSISGYGGDSRHLLALQPEGGFVGVGTLQPRAKLHVSGIGNGGLTSSNRAWLHTTHTVYQGTGTWDNDISIYATNDIVAGSHVLAHGGSFTSSDRRIKKDIIDIDDKSALETLRLLKPKQYKYLDVVRRGADPVWGFIAQEVSEVLPYSTSLRKEFIPNIYEVSSVEETSDDKQNIIKFNSFDTTTLDNESNIQLKIMDLNDQEQIVQVEEILSTHRIRVKEDLSKMMDEDRNIFVYGQEVNDFMFLKKESIFTVATAAVQEVDRQLQDTKAQLEEEKAKTASFMEKYESESKVLNERISALEMALK
jgi:hypothetical protein